MAWIASGNTSLPIARRDWPWNSMEARKRIFCWAGFDKVVPSKRATRAFLIVDPGNLYQEKSYRLPFTDVINGELVVIPQAVDEIIQMLVEDPAHADYSAEVVDKVWQKIAHLSMKLGINLICPVQFPTTAGSTRELTAEKLHPDLHTAYFYGS